MAFDPKRLLGWKFDPVRHSYRERDAILYALGLGLPADPRDASELAYVLEDRLKVVPTFAVTLASPGMWVKAPELEIDWVRLLHAAQTATFHRPLPLSGTMIGKSRIKSLHDRGPDKGAICTVERVISNMGRGALLCTLEQTLILRGNGGFGGVAAPKAEPPRPPDRGPDAIAAVQISPRAALIYRLSGDLNPLHANPETARKAGFEGSILHGLASYGIAGTQLLKHFCDDDPGRLRTLSMRFVGVVMPGDRMEFAFWREGESVLFDAKVSGRTVLDKGVALIASR